MYKWLESTKYLILNIQPNVIFFIFCITEYQFKCKFIGSGLLAKIFKSKIDDYNMHNFCKESGTKLKLFLSYT